MVNVLGMATAVFKLDVLLCFLGSQYALLRPHPSSVAAHLAWHACRTTCRNRFTVGVFAPATVQDCSLAGHCNINTMFKRMICSMKRVKYVLLTCKHRLSHHVRLFINAWISGAEFL